MKGMGINMKKRDLLSVLQEVRDAAFHIEYSILMEELDKFFEMLAVYENTNIDLIFNELYNSETDKSYYQIANEVFVDIKSLKIIRNKISRFVYAWCVLKRSEDYSKLSEYLIENINYFNF